jgi:predicted HTH domain antitoxin
MITVVHHTPNLEYLLKTIVLFQMFLDLFGYLAEYAELSIMHTENSRNEIVPILRICLLKSSLF